MMSLSFTAYEDKGHASVKMDFVSIVLAFHQCMPLSHNLLLNGINRLDEGYIKGVLGLSLPMALVILTTHSSLPVRYNVAAISRCDGCDSVDGPKTL